jgi:hypothetical protein
MIKSIRRVFPDGLLGRRNPIRNSNDEDDPMNTKDLLMNEIEEVPKLLLSEVLDLVHFLNGK